MQACVGIARSDPYFGGAARGCNFSDPFDAAVVECHDHHVRNGMSHDFRHDVQFLVSVVDAFTHHERGLLILCDRAQFVWVKTEAHPLSALLAACSRATD